MLTAQETFIGLTDHYQLSVEDVFFYEAILEKEEWLVDLTFNLTWKFKIANIGASTTSFKHWYNSM